MAAADHGHGVGLSTWWGVLLVGSLDAITTFSMRPVCQHTEHFEHLRPSYVFLYFGHEPLGFSVLSRLLQPRSVRQGQLVAPQPDGAAVGILVFVVYAVETFVGIVPVPTNWRANSATCQCSAS